jgi:hypothetical protein
MLVCIFALERFFPGKNMTPLSRKWKRSPDESIHPGVMDFLKRRDSMGLEAISRGIEAGQYVSDLHTLEHLRKEMRFESLMCLTLAQLRKPGCPVSLSANMSVVDMSSGLSTFGAPTKSTSLCAHAEVARSFGLPTWGLAGATDAKLIDAQAGLEATFHIMAFH